MTGAATERRWKLNHFRPVDMSDEDAHAEAKHGLREITRRDGYALNPDSIEHGEPLPIQLDDQALAGWRPHEGPGEPDGWITEWSASASEPFRDDETPCRITGRDGEIITAAIPAHAVRDGGGVRVHHELHGPVTVTAYAGPEQVGYLIAQDLDDDTQHVEVLAGTTHLVITRDPDEDEESDE